MMRPMIKWVKENLKEEKLVGVEVGVWEGVNAKSILENLDMKLLFLVDPWKKHRIYNGRLFSQDKLDICLIKTISRLISFEEKWHIIKRTSNVGSKHVFDNLDFVYIDAQHIYKNCKEDIAVWYPKLVTGGIFGGHDYDVEHTPGICKAVDEFVKEKGLELYQEDMDWWVVKE